MQRPFLPVGLLVLVLGLLAMSCGNKPGAAQEPVKLAESDDGHDVELGEGQVLEIVLPANPSTGYRWEVDTYDAGVLEMLGAGRYTPAEGSEDRVGAGGEIEFRFKGIGPGETELVLGNIPPGKESAEDTFEVSVTVTTASHSSGHEDEESGGHDSGD